MLNEAPEELLELVLVFLEQRQAVARLSEHAQIMPADGFRVGGPRKTGGQDQRAADSGGQSRLSISYCVPSISTLPDRIRHAGRRSTRLAA